MTNKIQILNYQKIKKMTRASNSNFGKLLFVCPKDSDGEFCFLKFVNSVFENIYSPTSGLKLVGMENASSRES